MCWAACFTQSQSPPVWAVFCTISTPQRDQSISAKLNMCFFQVFSKSVIAQTSRATCISNSCCSACCSHYQRDFSSPGDSGIHQGRTLFRVTLVKPCGVVSLLPRHTRGGTLCLRPPAETCSVLLALKLFPNPYFLKVGLFSSSNFGFHLHSHCKSAAAKCQKKPPIPAFLSSKRKCQTVS